MTAAGPTVRDGFELGCNYWPRRSAMYMWRALDLGEVRAWARKHGYQVSDRGRVSAEVMDAYERAN